MKKTSKMCAVGIAMISCCAEASIASIAAISLDPSRTTVWTRPNVDANYGWAFTVDEPLVLTHLGMLDVSDYIDPTPDGFLLGHDLGLYESNGTLLRRTRLDYGDGGIVVDHFRYAAVLDLLLEPGINYIVVSHYPATTPFNADWVISDIPEFDVHPAVNYGGAQVGLTESLAVPPDMWDPNGSHPYLFGPNFLVVPEPGTVLLIGVGAIAILRRRSQK